MKNDFILDKMGHKNYYSIYTICGVTDDEVDAVLTKEFFVQNGVDPSNVANGFLEVNLNGITNFTFEIAYEIPDFAETISILFPNKIVIGEGGWDLDYYEVYKNGNPAKKREDFNSDCEIMYRPDEDDLYDVEITFFNMNDEKLTTAFFGAIDKDTANALTRL